MALKALDISKHQGTFAPVVAQAQSIELVICRAAYGTAKDVCWDRFTADIQAAGLPLAAYGFLTAHYAAKNGNSMHEAQRIMREQVNAWGRLCKAQSCRVLAVDQELERGNSMALNKAQNTQLLREAVGLIREIGIAPVVYASASWVLSYIDWQAVDADFWVAYYPAHTAASNFARYADGTFPGGRYGDLLRELRAADKLFGWQYGSTGWGHKYGAGSPNIDRNWIYKMEEKPVEWTKIEGKQLRCTSPQKPACEVFDAPAVDARVAGRLELDEACGVLDEGVAVKLTGMEGRWYRIARDGVEVYCLALPDRCIVEDKPAEPTPTPEQEGAEVNSGKVMSLAGMNAPQAQIIHGLAALWGVTVTEQTTFEDKKEDQHDGH